MITFNASSIPISTTTVHQYQIDWQKLAEGEKGVTVEIDLEGDGIFDQTISAGKEFHIEKTNLSYLGDTSGYFSDSINLKAVLTDENGKGIPNKEIIFTLGDQTASSTTNENGVATTTLVLELIPKELTEIHFINVLFPGDDDYLATKTKTDFTLKSAKWLKQDVIKELEAVKIGEKKKKIDKEIDQIIRNIQDSFVDREGSLWIDASRLVSDCPRGLRVFHEEKKAVMRMLKYLQPKLDLDDDLENENNDKNNNDLKMKMPPEVKAVFSVVIEKLFKVDQLLAKVIIYDAKNTLVLNPNFQKIVDHQIAQAEKALAKSYQELEKGRPDKAIKRLEQAWHHSQLAIKFANLKLDE